MLTLFYKYNVLHIMLSGFLSYPVPSVVKSQKTSGPALPSASDIDGRGGQGGFSILPMPPYDRCVSSGDSSLILKISWLTHPHIPKELAFVCDHWEM